MGVLAHVFEAAGLATVGLSLIRRQAENIKAPRMLHCEFPLGRPLGIPNDPAFQIDVMERAFALLERTDVPVLEDHPMVIRSLEELPAACPLPPRFDATVHPAIDEALGLRNAYNRQLAASGRTVVGRVCDADGIAGLVEKFVALAGGASLSDVGFDKNDLIAASQDIRGYYEEAALALVTDAPTARQIESWLYDTTQTGAVFRAARETLKASDLPFDVWGYMMPTTR